jgi:hypothetical protein
MAKTRTIEYLLSAIRYKLIAISSFLLSAFSLPLPLWAVE